MADLQFSNGELGVRLRLAQSALIKATEGSVRLRWIGPSSRKSKILLRLLVRQGFLSAFQVLFFLASVRKCMHLWAKDVIRVDARAAVCLADSREIDSQWQARVSCVRQVQDWSCEQAEV